MVSRVNGFLLEVTTIDGSPAVKISMRDGTSVFDTNKVSATGLERLSVVFEKAAFMARAACEEYYRDRH